jgi:hypothetical protein
MQTSVVVFPVLVVLVVGGGLLQVGVKLEERTKKGHAGVSVIGSRESGDAFT